MKAKTYFLLIALFAVGVAVVPAMAQEPFKNLVGDVPVADVPKTDTLQVPFILWGGDVATFVANGGLDTQPGTLFARHGLKLHLTPGDNFAGQVKDYLEGKSPFLRGTMSMICQASEVIGADPRTKPVVFLQLTWSNGDHLVDRSGCKSLADLKGKTVALQKGGPHVGMMHDCLTTAGLTWSDVNVKWTDDVTGANGPAELFRNDPKVDACFAITPDMLSLTGGLDKSGTGAEGTVKGARVLVSTMTMNGSIADVYACRSDFFQANRALVEKFAAGYLKACEELADVRNKANDNKDTAAVKRYKEILKLTMDIYNKGAEKGKEPLPGEADTDGLIADAEFAFLPGNVFFFQADKWGVNFAEKKKAGMTAAQAVKSIGKVVDFGDAGWDFAALKTLGGLQKTIPTDLTKLPERKIDLGKIKDIIGPISEAKTPGFDLDTNTIAYFTIGFDPDQDKFDETEYGAAFEKAVKDAAVFRNAVIAVRGHADLAQLLSDFVKASIEKGYLKRQGPMGGPYKYYLKDGNELKLEDTAKVIKLVNEWDFTGASENPKRTLAALDELSSARAKTVQSTVLDFAKKYNLTIDKNQIQSVGIGVLEPVAPTPRDKESMARNRRVEFRIYKVPAEATEGGGF